MCKIYFVSSGRFKFNEMEKIFKELNVDIKFERYEYQIDEIQSQDMIKIVKDKLIKAFKAIGHPVIVEHTGLFLKDLNEFPGGFTQPFWDSLDKKKFSDLFSEKIGERSGEVKAKSIIGYCNGKKIEIFEGEVEGVVVKPRGNNGFKWDCIFKPVNSEKTFAEMEDVEKNQISMRRKATEKLAMFLKGEKSER